MKSPANTLRRRILEALAASPEPLDTSALAAAAHPRNPQSVYSSVRNLAAQLLIARAGYRPVSIMAGGGMRPLHRKTAIRPVYRITDAGRDWLIEMPAAPTPGQPQGPRHDHSALTEAWR